MRGSGNIAKTFWVGRSDLFFIFLTFFFIMNKVHLFLFINSTDFRFARPVV